MMNAKDFLSQARILDEQVQSKLMQVEALKSMACRVTTVYGAELVAHTRNASGMEDIILRITEAEEELQRKIVELVSAFCVCFFFFAMLFGASYIFSHMKETRQRTTFLMWPVSNMEKFLVDG